jgi:hypothetical protein
MSVVFRNRAEFMCHMKPSEWKPSSSGPASGNWTLVDEAGEEVTCVALFPLVRPERFFFLARNRSKHFVANLRDRFRICAWLSVNSKKLNKTSNKQGKQKQKQCRGT